MLFLLTGSSGSGKTTVARALDGRIPQVRVHDFDEVGVPDGADKTWRHTTLEYWVQKAVEYQNVHHDTLLACQSPLGEMLATPSATALDGYAVALLDVDNATRRSRLQERDESHWSSEQLDAFEEWARWHRLHARDPQHDPEVLTHDGWHHMRWDRWSDWTLPDPRWATTIFQSGDISVEDLALQFECWIQHLRNGLDR